MCAQCHAEWSTATCDVACPMHLGAVCGNNGYCLDAICYCSGGYCGAACETSPASCVACPAGYWGATCSDECPGGASNPCTGHGDCNSQRSAAVGTCVCDHGFALPDCSALCPGGVLNQCSGHGTCQLSSGSCICDPFYGSAACSIECPGLSGGNVCSGHGTCSQGSIGTGECACSAGYTSLDCSLECPGGVIAPCSGHGSCNADATCTCSAGDITGYWAGADCGVCDADWYGPLCNEQCGKVGGLQCAGHGSCSSSVACVCDGDSAAGFWTGTLCDDCAAGYYGSRVERRRKTANDFF